MVSSVLILQLMGQVLPGKVPFALSAPSCGYYHLDTGAMYRCVAIKQKKKVLPWNDELKASRNDGRNGVGC